MRLRMLIALLYRPVLMLPLGLLLSFAVLGAPALLVALPCCAGVLLLCGAWGWGLACLAAMTPALLARRWLRRFIVDYPPTML